jgi:phosphoadenosine phosphosulfate reductase
MDKQGSLSERDLIPQWQVHLETKGPDKVIQWAVDTFRDRLVFASSLGTEDQVIIHFLAQVYPETRIFTLDTGRLFPETYELIASTEARYNLKIEVFIPNSAEVEAMVKEHGINLFYTSVENRKLCCGVRKIHPLRRALAGVDAWICGLRRDQAATRQQVQVVEWDDQNALVKINPLWNWSESNLWDFIKQNRIPYNPLHDQGFPSIGCSCCTRAVAPGEDVRAGRWWWEQPENKECGLHLKGGRLVRVE